MSWKYNEILALTTSIHGISTNLFYLDPPGIQVSTFTEFQTMIKWDQQSLWVN